MASAFVFLLRRYLAERVGDNARHLAKDAGLPPTYLYKIIAGRRPPPMDRIIAIADALRLSGTSRYDFLMAAVLAHVPDEARSMLRVTQTRHRRRDVDVVRLEVSISQNPPAQRRRGRRPSAPRPR